MNVIITSTSVSTTATCRNGQPAQDQEQVLHPRRWQSVRQAQDRRAIPLHIRLGVYIRDDWMCFLCRHRPDRSTLQLDHIVPWSAGGSDSSLNLRTLCAMHNMGRSNWELWEDHRKTLPISAGCLDCQPEAAAHSDGTLTFCMLCRRVSYSIAIDCCWLARCQCGHAKRARVEVVPLP